MAEDLRKMIREEKIITISRVGDDFHYKTHVAGAEVDFSEKIGQQSEWEDKEKDPILHIKVSYW